ncbi:MAG: hypothetical protein Q4A82_03745 [Corynebacterium sp.]|nr:hypothetical protein [Corynebacterium sp.]
MYTRVGGGERRQAKALRHSVAAGIIRIHDQCDEFRSTVITVRPRSCEW